MRTRYEDIDDSMEIIPDGGSVRVGMLFMDSVQREIFDADNHRPHYGQLTDQQRQLKTAARDAYIKQTCEAWRTVSRDQKPDKPDNNDDPDNDDDDDDQTRRASAYQDYKRRLANAWKSGRTVVGPGPAVAGPGPSIVGAGPTRSSRDAQAMRDAAWNEYRERLSNAWRGGR